MLSNVGTKIRELRLSAGMSQETLAELASLNRVTIAKYEAGRVEPGALALSRIADALDVPADVLLGRQDLTFPEDTVPVEIPKTLEAKIISGGIDKLPKEQREQALNVMRAVFAQYADYFEKGNNEDVP